LKLGVANHQADDKLSVYLKICAAKILGL
jgi:hypothetical protein